MLMKLELICEGLKSLLVENNYSPATISFYEREWKKLNDFLMVEYQSDDFDITKGFRYLEKEYGILSKYEGGEIPRQRVQMIRVIQMLGDYQLHKVLTRRYYATGNPITLKGMYVDLYDRFYSHLELTQLSSSTKKHYLSINKTFFDFLIQKDIIDISLLNLEICNDFIRTFSGMSYKTIEQHICGMRYFLRYAYTEKYISIQIADQIHMPKISKTAKIPSVWTKDELSRLLNSIDRNSPIGKRDYAMILIACVLGLRSGDIKNLQFDNFNWEQKKLDIIQHKTHKPLSLPIPDAVGWAVIDYIKNGRPKYFDTKNIFIKHMPPFDTFSEDNHLNQVIHGYMRKAGIPLNKDQKRGFHSLRHSAASMLLENNVQLPVITSILGHSSVDITSIYLKTDLEKLKECVLELDFDNEIQIRVQKYFK